VKLEKSKVMAVYRDVIESFKEGERKQEERYRLEQRI
jgi:hypothetical protein